MKCSDRPGRDVSLAQRRLISECFWVHLDGEFAGLYTRGAELERETINRMRSISEQVECDGTEPHVCVKR